MKKFFSIMTLVLTLVLILSACGGNDMPSSPQPTPEPTPDIDIDTTPPPAAEPQPPDAISSIKVVYSRISWRENMFETVKIQSVDELQDFYVKLKDVNMNPFDEDLIWLFTGGQYDDDFFASHFLVLITTAENSGSNRHELTSIEEDNGVLNIYIDRLLPFVGTMDMAGWLIMIELSNDYSINETNVIFNDVQLED